MPKIKYINEFKSEDFPQIKKRDTCPTYVEGSVFFVTVFWLENVANREWGSELIKEYMIWKYKDHDGIRMDKRTWGFYSSIEQADWAVRHNVTDIYEYEYTYAVVEEIPFSMIAMHKRQWFYKWNKTKEMYDRIKKCPIAVKKWFCTKQFHIYDQFTSIG